MLADITVRNRFRQTLGGTFQTSAEPPYSFISNIVLSLEMSTTFPTNHIILQSYISKSQRTNIITFRTTVCYVCMLKMATHLENLHDRKCITKLTFSFIKFYTNNDFGNLEIMLLAMCIQIYSIRCPTNSD